METGSVLQGLVRGGVAACIAETVTLPMDVVKTRLQYDKRKQRPRYCGIQQCLVSTAREGPATLWSGLRPALLRQATYGSLRYGMYRPLATNAETVLSPTVARIVAGAAAGGGAALVTCPFDLLKVRQQLRATTVADVARGGVAGLWTGAAPTVARATVLASVELSTYDTLQHAEALAHQPMEAHIIAATVAGFLATLASNPFDVIKSRLMGQEAAHYTGMLHCARTMAKEEGLLVFLQGFWASYARVGPRVLIIFSVLQAIDLFTVRRAGDSDGLP